MTKALVLIAALGLSVSGVSACEFMRSAKSLDKTTVASIVNTEAAAPAMSTPETADPADAVKDKAAADQEG